MSQSSVEMIEHGIRGQRGNLLGVQPYMNVSDYSSGDSFFAKLDFYLNAASQKGWINERAVVVFPEYIGTWLICANERASFFEKKKLQDAMSLLAVNHIFRLIGAFIASKEKDRLTASLFRVKARETAALYHSTFSALAKKYSVTIVAGSIMLPSPEVKAGVVVAGQGPLYNACAVFRSDGLAYPDLVRKSFPVDTELSFAACAPINELPVFETPAGKLGVLICADSFYPEAYAQLKDRGVEMIAVPSYEMEDGVWNKPWGGYNGAPAPDDVDKNDVGKISEADAWHKYALAGRLEQAGAKYGVNVFLRGSLWDLGTDGPSLISTGAGQFIEAKSDGDAILNLWL
jgi:predicted amidohydrolase